jgi:hypothetical protein
VDVTVEERGKLKAWLYAEALILQERCIRSCNNSLEAKRQVWAEQRRLDAAIDAGIPEHELREQWIAAMFRV